MRNVPSLVAAFAVWAAILATMPTLVDSPWTTWYADLMPWEVQPVATGASLAVSTIMAAPVVVTVFHRRWLVFKRVVTIRCIFGLVMLLAMGSLEPGGIMLVVAASVAAAAMPAMVHGWRRSIDDVALLMFASLLVVPLTYNTLPFMPALLAALYLTSITTVRNLLPDRSYEVVEPQPGFDFRGIPLSKHPGGNNCGCPRHRMRREHPDTMRLCRDCMGVFREPAGIYLRRRTRATLWLIRNISVRFMALEETGDADECWFCGTRRGGLRGKKAPPPDTG